MASEVASQLMAYDALGAHGLIISGHATDLYDPETLAASTGSLFALPAVRVRVLEAYQEWSDSYYDSPYQDVFLTDADTRVPADNDGLGYLLAEIRAGADAVGGVPSSSLGAAGPDHPARTGWARMLSGATWPHCCWWARATPSWWA